MGVTGIHATMPESGIEWSFIAMQYYWLIMNRTFEVFVTGSMICGARVRGVIASPEGTEPQQHDPLQYVSARLRRRYDTVDVEAPAFLAMDHANFQLQRSTLCSIEYYPKNGVWVGSRILGDWLSQTYHTTDVSLSCWVLRMPTSSQLNCARSSPNNRFERSRGRVFVGPRRGSMIGI